jgi:site-specific recombinase XerD
MIYKRGQQAWYRFKWTVKHADGTRENFLIQRSAHTSSKLKAREVEEEHRRALRLGQVHPKDSWPPLKPAEAPTVREFSARFLKHSGLHTKPGTARFYSACVDNLLRYSPLAECRLSNVNGELANRYAMWRQAFPESPPSIERVNGELRTLRRMLYLALDWQVIDKTPSIHELPGAKNRDYVVSFEDEAKYLMQASSTLRDIAILAADTGLRPNSELFTLEWESVNLEQIDETPEGFIHVAKGKTKNAIRNVPLTGRSREVLLRRKQEIKDSRYVFPGEGRSGHIVTVQHAHERTINKAKISYFEFYCWRHAFGTRMAESGVDKFALASLMGHSSPSVAERYYIHVTQPHIAAGFEKFAAYRKAKEVLAHKKIEAFPKQTERVQ